MQQEGGVGKNTRSWRKSTSVQTLTGKAYKQLWRLFRRQLLGQATRRFDDQCDAKKGFLFRIQQPSVSTTPCEFFFVTLMLKNLPALPREMSIGCQSCVFSAPGPFASTTSVRSTISQCVCSAKTTLKLLVLVRLLTTSCKQQKDVMIGSRTYTCCISRGCIEIKKHYSFSHRWSSGRILPCHGRDPGSIPGRCTVQ